MIGLYNIPTQSLNIFDKYIEQIKPYHTKILDSSVTFTYTDYINVSVSDNISIVVDEGLPYSNAYICQAASVFGTFFDPSMIGSTTICSLSYLPSGYDDFQFDDIQPQTVLTIASATSGTIVVTGDYQTQLTFGIFLQIRNAQQSSGFYRVVSSQYNATTDQTTITLSSNIGHFSGGELVFGLEGFDPLYANFDFSSGVINALVTEDLIVSGTLSFLDSVQGYNFENTDSNGYDIFSFGSEYDVIPNIISHDVSVLPHLSSATGMVYSGITTSSSIIITEGYDGYIYEDYYDRQPYTLWFPYWYNQQGNVSGQGLLLTGGNYVRRFENIHSVTLYNESSRLQATATASLGICELILTSTPLVSGTVSSNSLSVSGNFSSVFVNGYAFYISGSTLNNGWYTVESSRFDGTYTIIDTKQYMKLTVYDNPDGTVIYNNFAESFGYIIPAIFTNQLINPATVLLVDYVYFNATSISYSAPGPLNINSYETFSPGIISGSVHDANVFSPELTLDDYQIVITEIFQPDRLLVSGNFTTLFPPLARFYINGSSNVNAKFEQLTCLSSTYNAITNQTSITLLGSLPISTAPYGFIQLNNPPSMLPNISSASVTEDFSFGWNHTEWFQYLILDVDTTNNVFIINAPHTGLGNVPPGIDIQVINGPNKGYYQVESSTYSVPSGAIVLTVTTSIPSGVGGGYIEPPVDMESGLTFADNVQTDIQDNQLGTIYTYNTINLINTWNTSYWSVGSFS
jgi:hypothetical protein